MIKNFFKSLKVYRKTKKFGELGSIFSYKRFFLKSTIDICRINKDNYHQFLDDIDYTKGHPYNGKCSALIDNKLFLPFFLAEYKEYLPEYFFYKDNKGFIKLSDSIECERVVDASFILEFVKSKVKLAAKHTRSAGGESFCVLEYIENHFYLNRKQISSEDLKAILMKWDEYIITEYIKQHDYANKINAGSLNTIRLLTYWSTSEKSFKIHSAFQRFGCGDNIVDNISSGNGVLSFIDIQTGKLTGDGEVKTPQEGDKYVENIIHPTCKLPIKGIEIPNYEEMCNKVIEICNRYCFMNYMGWDIAITKDSFKVVEINSLPSLDVVQQDKPFKLNPDIIKVLKINGN